jgi:hypothetical protein
MLLDPMIPPEHAKKLQGVLLRSQAMEQLGPVAQQAAKDVGSVAKDQQARGERVDAEGEVRITSTSPGSCFSGPIEHVNVGCRIRIRGNR